jgi:carboxymethylenebutenolidase
MRNLLLAIAALFVSATAYAQDAIPVCQPGMHDRFVVMASAKGFKEMHQRPRLHVHRSQQGGKMMTLKCPDGTSANAYFLKAKDPSDNWIFVFQEWWGLNDNIKAKSEELYNSLGNVNVIALDMYDGQVTSDRDQALKLIQAFEQDRGDMIVKGALEFAGSRAKVGTIGWCFGGTQSLMASLNAGKQAVACVIYYGMPVDDVAKLKTLNPDVLGIFGTKDKHITPEAVTKFEANMKAAGKKVTIMNFDADHGFANPSNAIYDKDATDKAYAAVVQFFKQRLPK